MRVHCLKTWPEYYRPLKAGVKPFEVRKMDRPFAVGDIILAQNFVRGDVIWGYTGEECAVRISYILVDYPAIEYGYGVLGVKSASIDTTYGHWLDRCKPWDQYPIGTKAKNCIGGWWVRTKRGWNANGGDTFPGPGGDAMEVMIPVIDLVDHGAHTLGRGYMRTCGQCAVAMVAHETLKSACRVMGTNGPTSRHHIEKGLDAFGLTHGHWIKGPPSNYGTHIVTIRGKDNRGKDFGHWIVMHEGVVYDSAGGIGADYPLADMKSHLEVKLL